MLEQNSQIGDYRSINRVPTALGIERKACIVFGVLAGIYFQITSQLFISLMLFAVLWVVMFLLTCWEPRIFAMLPDLWRKKDVYCPMKFKGHPFPEIDRELKGKSPKNTPVFSISYPKTPAKMQVTENK